MKSVFLTAVCLAVILGVVSGAPTPADKKKYPDKYDHLNVDEILQNKRTTNVYIKCVLDKGPCPPEGQELKEHIPEALETACEKCTSSQKNFIRKSIRFLAQNRPEDLELIHAYYDKDSLYRAKFMEFVNSDD
uniref:Uncharacterized protein n=1 Tax=Timema genevievae TaxID=629358 RepID=A0A7R9K582_TIMGE|nr:unnamed protein product [Timema genevievae]